MRLGPGPAQVRGVTKKPGLAREVREVEVTQRVDRQGDGLDPTGDVVHGFEPPPVPRTAEDADAAPLLRQAGAGALAVLRVDRKASGEHRVDVGSLEGGRKIPSSARVGPVEPNPARGGFAAPHEIEED